MKAHGTPACRAWFGVLSVFALLLAAPAVLAAGPGCATPEANINPGSLTIGDFKPLSGGGWALNPVTVNGQSSKPNANQGGLFQWSFVGTSLGTLANANAAQAQFTPPDVTATTQVVLRLTVTVSGCPGSDSEDITITITNAHDEVINTPPHAVPTATPAAASEGTLVTLDGSASWDAQGPIASYAWAQTGGPAVTLQATANPAIRTFVAPNFSADTNLTFQLTVSDGTLSNSAVTYVNVTWTNDPPVAALACPAATGYFDVDEGAAFTFDGSASHDSDDGIASYAWKQEVGLPEVPGVGDWNTATGSFTVPALGYGQTGLVPFTLTVTDHAGAKSSASCALLINDITAPSISVPSDLVAEATSATGAIVGAAEGYDVSAFDAVAGGLPLVNTSEYFLCEPAPNTLFALDAVTPVLCRAWDASGNEASAGFSVSVVDTTAPTISVPLSFAVEATGPDGAAADYVAKSDDIVDGERDALCVPASGHVFPINTPGPTTTVDCDASDAHGNQADTQSFTVAVHDTTPPAFDPDTVSADLVAEATSPAGASVSFALPSANDLVDLGNVQVACVPASPHVFPLGATTVQCDATDTRGNSTADDDPSDATPGTSATFKVTVEDTTPPTLGAVSDRTLEALSAAGAPFAYTAPAATDLVDGDRPVTCSESPALLAAGVFPLGTTTVTCSASDTRGNTASTAFAVKVVDTTPPTLSLPGNLVEEATGPLGAAVSFSVSASDLVDASVLLVCSAHSGDTFALGTTTVTCTGTDDAGNSASGSFAVTVRDTTAPAIAAHDDVTAFATANSAATVSYSLPTATDLVDGSVAVTCTPPSGSSFNVGSTTVTCSAQDSRGNAATRTFAVIVSYNFNGFFQPIDNAPALNTVKAGSAVPVKFSLGGNQGMNIFQSTPASGVIACGATEGDAIEETVTAGSSSLQYDAGTGQYIYVWKTEKTWVGQCRILQVKLKDGRSRTALFKFK
ncbi:HYR domain-containing protein [Lysobacter solisilvae (ex Woo and Kim 2020)]|uniref:HYR domain-containing protein n=1 Tax=Agrilutibacter terrestris TaxID=2865112 RepID=A0A7H0FZC5_9GAMM|nr:HYR domain-containing protein [Lysobacter terrestris]QNP41391.1 HYR domain-containing protein [Lysobacter terrestris]